MHWSERPPSSSLSYGGHGNEDVRSPGSGGTPGPLSQQPPSHPSLDHSDPGLLSSRENFTLPALIFQTSIVQRLYLA
ncbi:hypothetical protein M8J75_016125 [Diaphorina citri]|nr:hypothetical protein M8J75_016125 [Diaphorina citri]